MPDLHVLDTDGCLMDFDGRKLRALLDEHGLTQPTAAEAIGCGLSSIEFWLAGAKSPDYDSLMKLVRFFRVSPITFFRRNDIASAGIGYLTPEATMQRNGHRT